MLISFTHRLIVRFKRLTRTVLLLGLLTPASAMAWYGGSGPFTPWGANPYGWSPAPFYRAPLARPPYWMQQPYPLNRYWPGYGGFPAPMSLAAPWSQPGSPWQTMPGGAGYNRWQVYGGMDQSGGVWMAFVYRGNINGLMGGGLLGNSWPGTGMGGGLMQPPLDNLFQNQGWDADRPA